MSKITRRSYKRKKIVMGLALFGAIGLVSTGFAAWVLSSNASAQPETGLKVGAVSESTMQITDVKIKGKDTKRGSATLNQEIETNVFSFNPKHDDDTGRVRYGASGDECGERLALTISGKISEAQNLGQLTIGPKTIPDAVGQAETAQYIVVPACMKGIVTLVENTDYTITEEAGIYTASFSYKVEFEWGNTFGGVNPGEYYDGFSETAIPSADINTTLTAMHNLLDNLNVVLEIVAHVN